MTTDRKLTALRKYLEPMIRELAEGEMKVWPPASRAMSIAVLPNTSTQRLRHVSLTSDWHGDPLAAAWEFLDRMEEDRFITAPWRSGLVWRSAPGLDHYGGWAGAKFKVSARYSWVPEEAVEVRDDD